jgi:predicted LPLAT superfamily acyltransferase
VTAQATWHTERERGSALGMRITVWLYRWLGHRIAQLAVFAIVAYFFATDAAGRRASRHYLARVYAAPGGADALGAAPSARHVFRHFLAFGLSILDRVGFWLGDPADFAVAVRGMEHLDRVASEGRGAVVLGSHLGSFDAMRLLAERRSPIRVNVLMYTRHAARINGILRRLDGAGSARRPGVRVIPVQPGGFQHVVDAKSCIERGEVVAILADRLPPDDARSVARVNLLDGSARLPEGPFRLAALLRCPVLLMSGLRRGQRRYEICVEPFAERVELPRSGRRAALAALCQRFADWLTVGCLSAPYQWFNFYEFFLDDEPQAGR